MFQSAPLTKARGDLVAQEHVVGGAGVSIRSPHQSKGRQSAIAHPTHGFGFQSAPLTKARGDSFIRWDTSISLVFQSAPLTKARGDLRVLSHYWVSTKFQSAPLTKARGDALGEQVDQQVISVSIRSPHQSKGRRPSRGRPKRWRGCFNPLPSPKQGETAL